MKKVRFSTHSSKQKRRWVAMGVAMVSVGLANPCGIHDAIEGFNKNDIEAECVSMAGSTEDKKFTTKLNLPQSESSHEGNKNLAVLAPLHKNKVNSVKFDEKKSNGCKVLQYKTNEVQNKSSEVVEQQKKKVESTLAKAISQFKLKYATEDMTLSQRSILKINPSLTCLLGKGGDGSVYSEKIEEKGVAMKMYEDNDTWKHELVILLSSAKGGPLKHKNIVFMLCTATSGSHLWIAFPLYEKGSALNYLKSKEKKLTEEEAWTFARDVAAGLKYLHQNDIAHLDIKPENILISRKNELRFKIADFGSAKIVKTRPQPKDTHLRGTPRYMAPEIYEHGSFGQKPPADIYSFGVSVYYMASGVEPFKCFKTREGLRLAKIQGYPLPPLERNSTLNDLVQSCIKRLPSERPEARKIVKDMTSNQQLETGLSSSAASQDLHTIASLRNLQSSAPSQELQSPLQKPHSSALSQEIR